MSTDHSGMRLGRLPTPARDRATNLKLARYLAALPAAPATADVSPQGFSWPMYANDRLGDCTCAAAGHMISVWSNQVDGKATVVAENDVIDLYNKVNNGRDAGADMVVVLNTWRQQGLGTEKILGFAEVDVKNRDQVCTALWLFGGLYIGVELPISAQHQGIWDAATGPQGVAGSWGGHAINVVAYDADGLTVVTWGATKRITWAFWSAYCDEAYVAISADYDRLQGKALSNGFNEDQLRADLAGLTPVSGGS